jgi:ParB family chromosome partitioning protein
VAKTTGLGQGVGLLFGNDNEEKYFECDIDKITPNKYQPRLYFDEADLLELSESIRENGIIQPLIVTLSTEGKGYELIAGERRLRASKLAGLEKVPVVVMDVTDEDTLLELALIENIQRTDLNPIEEAEAYHKLIQKFGYTQEETAKRVGKKRSTISNMLRLLNLPDFIKQDLVSGTLSEGHARALLRLSDDLPAMKEIRDLIIKKSLSVRQTEKIVRKATSTVKHSQVSPQNKDQSEIPTTYCKALVNQLTNKLSSKVYINQAGSRGKLEIEYYSVDDLERLISVIMNETTNS